MINLRKKSEMKEKKCVYEPHALCVLTTDVQGHRQISVILLMGSLADISPLILEGHLPQRQVQVPQREVPGEFGAPFELRILVTEEVFATHKLVHQQFPSIGSHFFPNHGQALRSLYKGERAGQLDRAVQVGGHWEGDRNTL